MEPAPAGSSANFHNIQTANTSFNTSLGPCMFYLATNQLKKEKQISLTSFKSIPPFSPNIQSRKCRKQSADSIWTCSASRKSAAFCFRCTLCLSLLIICLLPSLHDEISNGLLQLQACILLHEAEMGVRQICSLPLIIPFTCGRCTIPDPHQIRLELSSLVFLWPRVQPQRLALRTHGGEKCTPLISH